MSEVKKDATYYITLPTRKVAEVVMEILRSEEFRCHTLQKADKGWFFLAQKFSPTGKMNRDERHLVKRIVEEYGGQVDGWVIDDSQIQ